MSQDAAAVALDMSGAQLSRVENAKGPYTQDLLEAAARLYRTDVVSLLIRDPTDERGIWTALDKAALGSRRPS